MDGPLTHVDADGTARMVDVADKDVTERFARVRSLVRMDPVTARLVRDGDTRKGDVLGVARLAGIMAAKRTSELIPLAHQVALTNVTVDLNVDTETGSVAIEATARTHDRTGVEMEAMVAASLAALTVYDMVKGHDRAARIESVHLIEKRGGRSGHIVIGDSQDGGDQSDA